MMLRIQAVVHMMLRHQTIGMKLARFAQLAIKRNANMCHNATVPLYGCPIKKNDLPTEIFS